MKTMWKPDNKSKYFVRRKSTYKRNQALHRNVSEFYVGESFVDYNVFEDLRWLRRLLANAANEKHIRFGLGGFHFTFSPSSISLTVPISSEYEN
ncbi:hypothetical protein VNO80_13426 [Phaseolus coccineus]|uniref:Uncharacterized protein n=1 Tax=Phaseolus coccineus TaxID=3886 RepID=A0AAN9R704_PHACN